MGRADPEIQVSDAMQSSSRFENLYRTRKGPGDIHQSGHSGRSLRRLPLPSGKPRPAKPHPDASAWFFPAKSSSKNSLGRTLVSRHLLGVTIGSTLLRLSPTKTSVTAKRAHALWKEEEYAGRCF